VVTTRDPNGEHWTLGTLLLYLEARIDGLKESIDSVAKRFEDRFAGTKDALRDTLAAADRATTKAENASDERFRGVNEFRATLADQARDLMPRLETETLVKALEARVAKLEEARTQDLGRQGGSHDSWALIGLAISVIVNIILGASIVSHWSNK
jgi:hypothetical protein